MAAAKVAFHPDASAEYAAAFLWYYARGTTIAYDLSAKLIALSD